MAPQLHSSTATTPTRAARPVPEPHPLRRVVTFVVLAYAFTWVLWIPVGLAARGALALPVPPVALLFVGGFGPLVAAVAMTARHEGAAGVRALFGQLDPRRAPKRWFLIPLLLVPLHLVPVIGYLIGGGTPPTGAALGGMLMTFPLQLVLVATVGGGLDEEMGWRGYALPALLRTTSPLAAGIVLGLIWAPWHLPLWLDPTSSQADYPFAVYLVKTVGLSVLLGWMYCGSRGNLAVVIWAHALANSTDGLRYQILGPDKGELVHQLTLMAVLVLAAVLVAVATRGRLGADRLAATVSPEPFPVARGNHPARSVRPLPEEPPRCFPACHRCALRGSTTCSPSAWSSPSPSPAAAQPQPCSPPLSPPS